MTVQRGSKCDRTCKNCGAPFVARVADVKRGWAKFCSKSCKAVKQEKRTGQYAAHLAGEGGSYQAIPKDAPQWLINDIMHQQAMDDAFSSHGQDENW